MNDLTPAEASEMFVKAVAAMDKNFPGWHSNIELSTLDMLDSMSCVLGQMTGEYSIGRGILALKEPQFGKFSRVFRTAEWTEEWKRLIKDRQDGISPVSPVPAEKFTVKLSDGNLMNVKSIKDVPDGVAFTIYEESAS